METDIKLPPKMIHIRNGESRLILEIDKVKILNSIQVVGLITFLFAFTGALIVSFYYESPLFSELIKAGFVMSLVAFIVFNQRVKNKLNSK
ncbi:hypothetical protein M0D21_07005 [Aquimarina sp. D1M17]|uniref:hypothetical protein n=1 Tax=Aquimarina acroporae TaxID=2937283 RepID=UPI0020BFB5CC|nr:hypothetical protein [Aquimarina acroporae]MCK8521307.1 hypothetical protein [Aquimarina acroporae]